MDYIIDFIKKNNVQITQNHARRRPIDFQPIW